MRAALLRDNSGKLSIEEVSIDKPNNNEVLVQIISSGLCHSDLHFIDGKVSSPSASPFPMLLGHEGAGIVQAVGADVRDLAVGDHVITCGSFFCAHCNPCLTGHSYQCENRADIAHRSTDETPRLADSNGASITPLAGLGAFAEEMLVHQNGVVKISKDMPFNSASIIGCGVTTGVGAVIRSAKVTPGSTVAVIGCGGIGISAVQGAHLSGARTIIAVDTEPKKLEWASRLGATHTINANDTDPVAEVRELTGGGVNFSFECVGLKITAEQAYHMICNDGVATIVGMSDAIMEIPVGDLFRGTKRVQGSLMGNNNFKVDIPQLCDLYMGGRLKLDEMITTLTLDEINDGFDAMKSGSAVRSVIEFN